MNTGAYGARAGRYNEGKLPANVGVSIGRAGTPMPLGAAQREAAHRDQILNVWGQPMRQHNSHAGPDDQRPSSQNSSTNSISHPLRNLSNASAGTGGSTSSARERVTDAYNQDGRFSSSVPPRSAPAATAEQHAQALKAARDPAARPYNGQFDLDDDSSSDSAIDQSLPRIPAVGQQADGPGKLHALAPPTTDTSAPAPQQTPKSKRKPAPPTEAQKPPAASASAGGGGFCCFGSKTAA